MNLSAGSTPRSHLRIVEKTAFRRVGSAVEAPARVRDAPLVALTAFDHMLWHLTVTHQTRRANNGYHLRVHMFPFGNIKSELPVGLSFKYSEGLSRLIQLCPSWIWD